MSVSRETLLPPWADVSRETLRRLGLFVTLLLRWNQRINLISRSDEGCVWQRHVADALQLVPLMPGEPIHLQARGIDLGSGGGFPGLILAIATSMPFDLVEADRRKAAFLREAARETAAPVQVHACRIEEAQIPPAALVTARALAPLSVLIPLAGPFMAPRGAALFPKGAAAEQELTALAGTWNMRVERHPSRIDRSGVILRISEVTRV